MRNSGKENVASLRKLEPARLYSLHIISIDAQGERSKKHSFRWFLWLLPVALLSAPWKRFRGNPAE